MTVPPVTAGAAAADRAALVVGGSTGIGKAMARVLGEEGYAVTIGARTAAKLEATAAELGAAGHTVQAVPADVADESQIAALVEAHRRAFGRLDVLVHSAGDGSSGVGLADLATEMLDRHLNVNLKAYFLSTRYSLDLLRAAGAEHGKALVVYVASEAGKKPGPLLSAYSAAKAGVVALRESAELELKRSGIQFTVFCPGITATPMSEWMRDAGVPLEEVVQPEDLGEGLRFLLRTSPTCHVPELVFLPPDQLRFVDQIVAHQAAGGAVPG